MKALERHWKMSAPEHLGPQGPAEKLKFVGAMITRAKKQSIIPRWVLLCGSRSLHFGSIGKGSAHP
eukprot:10048456-Prorocentrum_lima.AAC.1